MTHQEQVLIEAAKIGNQVEVQQLVNSGIKSFLCALRETLTNKHLEVVKYLVEKGADIHANNDYAFRFACYYDHLEND